MLTSNNQNANPKILTATTWFDKYNDIIVAAKRSREEFKFSTKIKKIY